MPEKSIIHRLACPVCNGTSLTLVLTARDNTVSHEDFNILECASCSLRFTQDVPDEWHIGRYYQSDAYISHTDEAKGLVNILYKAARNYTLVQKSKLLEARLKAMDKTLLDIGAGTGAFAAEMIRNDWYVKALEPDPGARRQAMEKHGIDLEKSGQLYEMENQCFSAITMWHVLEHVHELHTYVDRLKQLLLPGGLIFVAVPNYTSPDAQHYGKYWAAYDVPRHLYHFSPLSMKKLMEAHGLHIRETIPMHLDAFYIALLSEQYKKGSAGWLSAGWQGMETLFKAWSDKEKSSSLIYVIGHQG